VADSAAEARIRDLRRRLELEPGSRLFVALAEELRKTGRLAEALSTLQEGLLAHPNYVSAHVALGRAYLEAGQITEAIATFSKVLAADPGNLVSAKSLADIYLSRGESVEAIKKYKLYRALSGDRNVEDIIHRLEEELAPPPPPSPIPKTPVSPPPPPPGFVGRPAAKTPSRPREAASSVDFESGGAASPSAEAEPFPVLSRDPPFASGAASKSSPQDAGPATTRAIRISDYLSPSAGAAQGAAPGGAEGAGVPPAERPSVPLEPQGRTLADLYFAQGHYAEALAIYEDLLGANPFDSELRRLRRDAEARLLPAGSTPGMAAPDRALERRLGKIRSLKQWLSVIQAR